MAAQEASGSQAGPGLGRMERCCRAASLQAGPGCGCLPQGPDGQAAAGASGLGPHVPRSQGTPRVPVWGAMRYLPFQMPQLVRSVCHAMHAM